MQSDDRGVRDDTEGNRFVLADDVGAELRYRSDGRRLELVSTFTPPELRGQGFAARLVAAAAARARRTGETVVPACWYARDWLRDHPDETADLEIEW